jgi:thymidylate synthase ThyX
MEVVMHRFVLAEFNTHRAFSRNSASSRAIPTRKMIARVQSDPAYPISWPHEKPGMSGGVELDPDSTYNARLIWDNARQHALTAAARINDMGAHKSVINRLLEPFMWHTVIVTGDKEAYQNFFIQRCTQYAQPEIRAAANAMFNQFVASVPQSLDYGEWHMPLLQPDELDFYGDLGEDMDEQRKHVSAARCARVSYLSHDGVRDVKKDLELYDKLVTAEPPHWSPLEHVCSPWTPQTPEEPEPRGNLHGWVQLRHVVEAERLKNVRID